MSVNKGGSVRRWAWQRCKHLSSHNRLGVVCSGVAIPTPPAFLLLLLHQLTVPGSYLSHGLVALFSYLNLKYQALPWLSSNPGLPPLNHWEGSMQEEGLRTVQPNTFTVPRPVWPTTPGAGGSMIKITCYSSRFPAPTAGNSRLFVTLAPGVPATSSCLCRHPHAWDIHSQTQIYI